MQLIFLLCIALQKSFMMRWLKVKVAKNLNNYHCIIVSRTIGDVLVSYKNSPMLLNNWYVNFCKFAQDSSTTIVALKRYIAIRDMCIWCLKEKVGVHKMNWHLHLVWKIPFQYFRDFKLSAPSFGFLYTHPKPVIHWASKNFKSKLQAL